jgi:hypothetical protein
VLNPRVFRCTRQQASCDHSLYRYVLANDAWEAELRADRQRTPVLLITDIGADIDDTLALLVCLSLFVSLPDVESPPPSTTISVELDYTPPPPPC